MRLTVAVDDYLSSRRGLISPKTETNYRFSLSVLIAALGDVEIETVTLDRLRIFRAHLFDRRERYASPQARRPHQDGPLSVWSIATHIRLTRQFFKWLTDEGYLPANPAARLQVPEVGNAPPKGITEEDLLKMLDAARASPRDLALLMFLADTGCRVGGLAGLKLADLDLGQRTAIVREKGKRGSPKTRQVFFNPPTAAALKAWLKERRKLSGAKDEHLFIGSKGPLTGNGIYQIVERIGRDAGVDGRCNPHAFRHGLARALLERGLDLCRVARILGHSDERITARFYGVFSQAELAEAHDRYSWIKPR